MEKDKKYISSFDGIRTIALLSVLFYHLIKNIFVGGYLGVVVFFVLAGYLSMQKIMIKGKIEENRLRLALSEFAKKLIKLYPALILMLGTVFIAVFFLFKPQMANIENGIKGSILSISNYFQIFSGSSYFESSGSLRPFTHIWALSLEIQVYLLIYLFFHGRYEKSKRKSWIISLIVVSIISYGINIYMLELGYDYTRVYYDILTRLYSFSLGALACLISFTEDNAKEVFSKDNKTIVVSILLILLIVPNFIFEAESFVFYFGFLIYTIITAIILMVLSNDNSIFSKFLSNKFFSLMTKRAYHIYLWHFPIIALEDRYFANKETSLIKYYIIFFVVLIILTEFSLFISKLASKSPKSNMISTALVIIACMLLFIMPYKSITENTEESKALKEMQDKILENEALQKERNAVIPTEVEESLNKEKKEQDITGHKDPSTAPNSSAQDDNTEDDGTQDSVEMTVHDARVSEFIEYVNSLGDEYLFLDEKEYIKYQRTKALLIGDSLASMSYYTLAIYMPEVTFDSEHSRQMKNAYEAYSKYKDDDYGDYLILSLGTNGEIKHEDIEKVRSELNGKKLILLNVVLPYKSEEDSRNESITSYAEKHDDVYLIDWYRAVKNRPELFFDDKIHVGENGAKIMGQLIIKEIIKIEKGE